MKKAKKILALVLAFVLVIGATAAITMALLTDEEEAVNVMTVGNVYIDQFEQERKEDGTLQEFTQGQMLLPSYYTGSEELPMADPATWPVANDPAWSTVVANENVMDKFVTVTNTGTTEAYVRTVFAVEVGTCRDKLHLIVNDQADSLWAWEVAAQDVQIPGYNSVYDILVATYTEKLAPGEVTIPSLKQVYLDVTATNEDVSSFGGQYEILVKSQAVQAVGFTGATWAYTLNTSVAVPAEIEGALDVAFKDVTATQHPWEEGAQIPAYALTAEALQAALNKGGEVTLSADITVDEPLVIPEGVTVNLDLNGKTLAGEVHKNVGHVIDNDGVLNVSNGTVASNAANGGSAIRNDGTVTVTNTVITGAPREGSSWPAYAINNYGDMTLTDTVVTSTHGTVSSGKDSTIVMNNCEVTCNGFGGSSHVFYLSGSATVNGGTYTHKGNVDGSLAYIMSGASMTVNDGAFTASNGGYGLAAYGGSLTVNGGTFTNDLMNWGGPIVVTGGTFAGDVAKYLPSDYYECIKNEDGTYTAQLKDGVVMISNADELKAAFDQEVAAFAAKKPNTYVLAADIDMEGYSWTPYDVSSPISLDGQGHTISNMKISGTSGVGFFGYVRSSVNVKDVNFHSINVTGNHYVGVVFGWEGAESRQSYVTNVKVTDSTIDVTTLNGDDGDKVGGIGGYAVTTTITGCAVENTKISAYRDAGGVLGYANSGKVSVTDSSAPGLEMTWNNTVNYKNYSSEAEANLGIVVGEAVSAAKVPVETVKVEEIRDAAQNGGDLILTDDVEIESDVTAPYGNKTAMIQKGGVIDGNGNTLTVDCYGDDYGIMTYGGTIRNLTVECVARGIMLMNPTEDVILENVTVKNDVLYPMNTGEHSTVAGVDLIVRKSTFGGWTSFAGIDSASFTDCQFVMGNYGYGWPYDCLIKPYMNTTFDNCAFAETYYLDLSALGKGCTVTMTNCTVGDVEITADIFGTKCDGSETVCVELPSWATSIEDCVIFN